MATTNSSSSVPSCNLMPVELMATSSQVTHLVVKHTAGYFAAMTAAGSVRTFRLSDASPCGSRALCPAPQRLLPVESSPFAAAGPSPWVALVRDAALHLVDIHCDDQAAIEVPHSDVVCCALTSEGHLWTASESGDVTRTVTASPEAPTVIVAHDLPRCLFIGVNRDESVVMVVHRVGILFLQEQQEESGSAGDGSSSSNPAAPPPSRKQRRVSFPEAEVGDALSAAMSWGPSPTLVVACERGVVLVDVSCLGDLATQAAPALVIATLPEEMCPAVSATFDGHSSTLHWMNPPPAEIVDQGAPTLVWRAKVVISGGGASPASLTDIAMVDLPPNVVSHALLSLSLCGAAVGGGTEAGVAIGHTGGVWLSAVPSVPESTARSIVEAAAALFAQDFYTSELERLRAEKGRGVRSRFAVDTYTDSGDIDDYRSEMNVYIAAKLVGDLRPVALRLAVPATATAKQILCIAETAFDRRLSLGFVLTNGKVMEMRAASQKIFEAMSDDEKSLVCRPLFPGVSLSMGIVNGSFANSSSASALAKRRATSALSGSTIGGASPPRSVTPSVITKDEEKSMVKRLYETSVAAHRTNVLRLERQVYPTEHFRTTTPTAETVQRLAGPTARNRKREAIDKARNKCIQEGLIVSSHRMLEDCSEDDIVKRMYNERLKNIREAEQRLEEKHAFKPARSKVVLKTKEDWEKWHASMARDVRQTFRLPPDQMYYGKPSPRDRGHM